MRRRGDRRCPRRRAWYARDPADAPARVPTLAEPIPCGHRDRPKTSVGRRQPPAGPATPAVVEVRHLELDAVLGIEAGERRQRRLRPARGKAVDHVQHPQKHPRRRGRTLVEWLTSISTLHVCSTGGQPDWYSPGDERADFTVLERESAPPSPGRAPPIAQWTGRRSRRAAIARCRSACISLRPGGLEGQEGLVTSLKATSELDFKAGDVLLVGWGVWSDENTSQNWRDCNSQASVSSSLRTTWFRSLLRNTSRMSPTRSISTLAGSTRRAG